MAEEVKSGKARFPRSYLLNLAAGPTGEIHRDLLMGALVKHKRNQFEGEVIAVTYYRRNVVLHVETMTEDHSRIIQTPICAEDLVVIDFPVEVCEEMD
jgi:hypothetical protein